MAALFLRALTLFAMMVPATAQATGSLVIWPLNPTIEAHENAAALWLENPGDQPITLQVQSLAWAQQNGEDVYAPQKQVLATPPIVTIAPKAKQLIRITRLGPPPSQPEQPYRLIVDEIPVERAFDARDRVVTGVQFRMRYTLPLFTYAPGILPTSQNGITSSGKGTFPTPNLVWHLIQNGKQRIIEIENRGNGHARITQAKIQSRSGDVELAGGLMGYVLAGSRLRIPLPDPDSDIADDAKFSASINAAPAAVLPLMVSALPAYIVTSTQHIQ